MPDVKLMKVKYNNASKSPPATLTLISFVSKASKSDMDLGAWDVGETLTGAAVDISFP